MALSVAAVLRDGFGRTVSRNGLLLLAVFAGLRFVGTVVSQTVARANREFLATVEGPAPPSVLVAPEGTTPLSLPVPLAVALGLALAVAIVAEALRIVAVRTFASDRTDVVPRAFVARNLAPATVNGFVGGVVVLVLMGVGTVLLVVPGILVGVLFFFVRQEIAVEDESFVDAMAGSWGLTTGNRFEVLWLALVLVAVGLASTFPGILLRPSAPVLAAVLTAVLTGAAAVFGMASATRAYARLRAERRRRRGLADEVDTEAAAAFDP